MAVMVAVVVAVMVAVMVAVVVARRRRPLPLGRVPTWSMYHRPFLNF